MCDPTMMAVGSFAISAVQGIAQYQADQQAYDENEKYRLENIKLAKWNATNEYNQVLTQTSQEQEAAAASKADVAREARSAIATSTVAAGEAGVSGLSVDALLRDQYGQVASVNDRIDQNTDWTTQQLHNEMFGIQSQAVDRARGIRKGTPPSLFATGLKIAGAGLGAYGNYQGWTN